MQTISINFNSIFLVSYAFFVPLPPNFKEKFMKKTVLFLCFLAIASLSFAQNNDFSLKFNTRADFDYQYIDNENINDSYGFAGKFLNIMLDGKINDKFEYHWRQRLNRTNFTSNFFEATDWAYLSYHINDNFTLSAGKQVVAIGGFEYDYAPIDVYFYSDFCNIMPSCYEFGTSLTWGFSQGQALTFQISNSIFKQQPFDGLLAYNLLWNGNITDSWKTLYSVNLIEFRKNQYVNYVALGNQFYVGDFVIDLDYTNRYVNGMFFDDFTIVSQVKYQMPKLNVFAKFSYDRNNTDLTPDYLYGDYWTMTVAPGTDYMLYGAGVEYFPIPDSKDVRLHAIISSNNREPANLFFNAGITWNMKLK